MLCRAGHGRSAFGLWGLVAIPLLRLLPSGITCPLRQDLQGDPDAPAARVPAGPAIKPPAPISTP